jgi:hypothetical protein
MNIYILQGGIGKHVLFSSMIEKLSEATGEKIIIMSAYPDLFKFHPKVEKTVFYNEPGFYDEYVYNTKNNIVFSEPYFSNYVKGKTHILEEWCNLYNIKYDETILPDLYVDKFSIEESERFVNENKKFIIIQFSGGQSPVTMDINKQHISMGQIRDYPRALAQEFVNKFKEKYPDTTVLNYALPNELTYNLDGCIQIESPYLFYISLLNYAETFVSIDSSLHHFAANRYINKKGVVLWGSTSPKCLGYKKNINLTNAKDNKHSMRPLCLPVGDILNQDGSLWVSNDKGCMNISPDLVLEKTEQCIIENEFASLDLSNVTNKYDIVKIDDETKNTIEDVENQIRELANKHQDIIDEYLSSKEKTGQFKLSDDKSKLIQIGD